MCKDGFQSVVVRVVHVDFVKSDNHQCMSDFLMHAIGVFIWPTWVAAHTKMERFGVVELRYGK